MSDFEQNLSRAESYLARFKNAPVGHFIAGDFYSWKEKMVKQMDKRL